MNTTLSKISELEMKAIECHINDFAEENLSVSPEYILREWNSCKQELFNLFGGELILNKQGVVFTKNSAQIENEIQYAWDYTLPPDAKQFWHRFNQFCSQKRREITGGPHWTVFEISNKQTQEEHNWYLCENLLSDTVLANNSVEQDFTINIPKPDGTIRPYHVQKGSRPMRVLGRIIKAYGIDDAGFKELCVWQSQLLNDKKVGGEFCLSIHPLDYMTMSENTHGWTSCMSWEDSGCYRGGTVEMMNSPMVIVAYMDSIKEKMKLNAGWDVQTNTREQLEWNSKKWRTLIVVNETGIYSVKSYPYYHKEMTQYAMEWVASLFKHRHFEECEEFVPYKDWNMKDGLIINVNPRTYRMYNDFGAAKHYIMLDSKTKKRAINVNRETGGVYDICFCYSGASECMSCGALSYIDDWNNTNFDGEGALCCDNCHYPDNTTSCEICGANYDSDDMIWVEDVPVCPNCFDDECFEDYITYEYHFKDEGIRLRFLIENKNKKMNIGMVHWNTIVNLIKYEDGAKDNPYKDFRNRNSITLTKDDLSEFGLNQYTKAIQTYNIQQELNQRNIFTRDLTF